MIWLGGPLWAELPGVAAAPRERFDVVVIDAGHGGHDSGAQSQDLALAEKDLVLDVAMRVAKRVSRPGLRVVLTREDDTFVPLETRTAIANDARGDLFVSIHANASLDRRSRGTETYFLALEASDESAKRVARRENQAFPSGPRALATVRDPLVALLGDLLHTQYVRESDEFSRLVQGRLGEIDPRRNRGVKQAPFVVLLGVQMPAALVEIGFVSNERDVVQLRRPGHRDRIVGALTEAIHSFAKRYDARRGAR